MRRPPASRRTACSRRNCRQLLSIAQQQLQLPPKRPTRPTRPLRPIQPDRLEDRRFSTSGGNGAGKSTDRTGRTLGPPLPIRRSPSLENNWKFDGFVDYKVKMYCRNTCGRIRAFSLRSLAIRLRVASRRKSACSESTSRNG